MKITTKFASVMLLSLILFLMAVYLVTYETYKAELRNTARVAADNVNDLGTWAAQYGQIWVKDAGKSTHLFKESLSKPRVDTPLANNEYPMELIEYFGKNPALVQRELADVVAKSDAQVKFRLTSDNAMNPNNRPDEFEAIAISKIKAGGLKEFGKVVATDYRYTRPIYVKESCLKCHASPDTAPIRVVELYGRERGYNYKVGELAGVISVRVPAEFSLNRFYSNLSLQSYIAIALLVSSLLIPFLYVSMGILGRIKKLTHTAEMISMGKAQDADILIDERSNDEIDKLGAAVKRINKSFQLAIQQMRSKK
jgi:hypothetical protein